MTEEHYKPAEGRLAEAAVWRLRLGDVDDESLREFEAWLAEPGNEALWKRVEHIWRYVGEYAHDPKMVAARASALSHARRASVIKAVPLWGRRVLTVAAAVLILGVVGWGGMEWLGRPDDYQTVRGERRVITLADGSKLALDAESEVRVRYTINRRELQLIHGQARFDVAHDVERPFSVQVSHQKVVATGTAFNIDMAGQKVLVTMIEGRVVVLQKPPLAAKVTAPRWPDALELRAGQQLTTSSTAPPVIRQADIGQVTAWINGQIMFDNEELTSVAERVNRYSNRHVLIKDSKVAALRISGVLNSGDVDRFVDMVTHYLPVRAVAMGSGDIVLESQTQPGNG
jgi:transmembrane sensor